MKFAELTTKQSRIAHIKVKLAIDPQWAVRGLVRLYQYQTATEQQSVATLEHNGVGFNGTDGGILSSFAKQVQAGRSLSPKQMAIVHKKMPKYASQLERIADISKPQN